MSEIVRPGEGSPMDIGEALNAAVALREATPGRPEDGPYPASVGEVADEVVGWIDEMCDSGNAHRLNHAVLRRLLPSGVLDEVELHREQYVSDQVSRKRANAEAPLSPAQVDSEGIEAALRWDRMYPGSARLTKILGGVA